MLEEENKVVETKPTNTENKKPDGKKGFDPKNPNRGKSGGANRGPKKGQRKTERKAPTHETRVVLIKRISKTVKGGRRMKFSALVVLGKNENKDGSYGFACAKAAEVPDAIKKAEEKARKNMYMVRMTKNSKTIAHEVIGKYGACSVLLKPAPAGTGIIAGGPVRAILELAGIENVCSKVYGSRSAINVIRATHQALMSLKDYETTMKLRAKATEDKDE